MACFPRESVCSSKQFQEEENTGQHTALYNFIKFPIPEPLDKVQTFSSLHADPTLSSPRGCSSLYALINNHSLACWGQTLASLHFRFYVLCSKSNSDSSLATGIQGMGKRCVSGPNILLKDTILVTSPPPPSPGYHFFKSPQFPQCQPLGTNP